MLKLLNSFLTDNNPFSRAYHVANMIFILLIISIFLYSFFFTANTHPIPSLLTDITGEISPSKGLSASFSFIIRGELSQSQASNVHGIRIFSFFAIQLLLRLFFSMVILLYKRISRILAIDAVVSIGLFLWSFEPLIKYTFQRFGEFF